MSNSTTLIDQISSTQATKEVVANANFDAASPAMLWGRRASTTSGLTWGYVGGSYTVGATVNAIANGTVTLTASATNYVQASATTGAVSVNTTGFTAGAVPLYSIVTSATAVTSYTDCRSYQPSAIGGTITSESSEGSGVSVIDTASSTPQIIKLKTLVGAGGVTITDNGAAGIAFSVAAGSEGTVTGGANEGSGVGVFDAANSSSTTLQFKSLVPGTGITITDNGASGIAIGAAGGVTDTLAVQQAGSTVVSAATVLNFTGGAVVTADGTTPSQVDINLLSGFGTPDTIPVLSSFTQALQSGASVSQNAWGISLSSASHSGELVSAILKTAPATPYSVVARMKLFPGSSAYVKAGLCVSDGTKFQIMGLAYQTAFQYGITNMNSASSYSGFQGSQLAMTWWPDWHRIRDDGTNLYYDVSSDGVSWVNLYSFSRTAFLTPSQVGVCIDPNAQGISMSLFSWAGA